MSLAAVSPSFRHGEESGLGGGSVGNFFELGIMLAQRLGDFDLCAFEDADKLERVHDGFALIVVVGDYECVVSVGGHFLHARDPWFEFFGGIEVVVALVCGDRFVIAEPGVVATAVQADVADGGGGLGGRRKGFSDDGLVDVANAGTMFVQERERVRRIPSIVAHFDYQRVIAKPQQDGGKISHGFLGAMKRKRELQQDGAEFAGGTEHVEAGAHGALILGDRAGSCRNGVVSETLPEFRGEDETGIGAYQIDPVFSEIRPKRLVKRSVDFDGVEEFGEIGGFVKVFRAA